MVTSGIEKPRMSEAKRQVATQGNSGKQKALLGDRQGLKYVEWLLRVQLAQPRDKSAPNPTLWQVEKIIQLTDSLTI